MKKSTSILQREHIWDVPFSFFALEWVRARTVRQESRPRCSCLGSRLSIHAASKTVARTLESAHVYVCICSEIKGATHGS
jgi:hypothetical protein